MVLHAFIFCVNSVDIHSIECSTSMFTSFVSTVLTYISSNAVHPCLKFWKAQNHDFGTVSTVMTCIVLNMLYFVQNIITHIDSVNIHMIWCYGWKAQSFSFSKFLNHWILTKLLAEMYYAQKPQAPVSQYSIWSSMCFVFLYWQCLHDNEEATQHSMHCLLCFDLLYQLSQHMLLNVHTYISGFSVI